MLPKSDRRADRVASLAFSSIMILSIISLLIIWILKISSTSFQAVQELGVYIWLIPFAAASLASTNVINQINLRSDHIAQISNGMLVKSLSLAVVQIGLGLSKVLESGLIWGRLASHFFQLVFVAKKLDISRLVSNSKELRETLIRYRKFPLFNTWGAFANISAIYMVPVLIAHYYSISLAGEFALMQRVLVVPVFFIGQAFGQIYYRNLIQEKNQTGTGKRTYMFSFAILMLAGIIIFLPIRLWGVELIDTFLGGKVQNLTMYVKILTPMFFIRFVASPLSFTLNAFERQELNMVWQISLFLFIIIAFLVAKAMLFELDMLLKLYSSIVAIMYVIQIALSFSVAHFKNGHPANTI